MTLQAIVFDLDGVLIDSAACHRAAFEEVFLPFGVRDFEYSRYAGWRTAEVVDSVLQQVPCLLTPGLIAEVGSRKSQLARLKIAAKPVDPECLAVLEKLAARYKLALASSGSRESVESFLMANQCRHLFQSVLSGDNVSRAKPDPEIYRRSLLSLDVPAPESVVVEDAIAGILAARAAGAAVIGMAGTSPADQLLAAGASHVIDKLSQLPELLITQYEDRPY